MSGHASQIRFSRLGQARGASPGSLDQRSEEWPLCEGKSGALDASVRPSEGGRELRGPHGRLSSALPRGGGEQGGGGIGVVGRGLGFMWLKLAFRGGASGKARMQPYVFPAALEAASRQRVVKVEGPQERRASTPYVFPSSPEAASRQREGVSSAYVWLW